MILYNYCLSLTYFAKHDTLKVHPCCCKWQNCILFLWLNSFLLCVCVCIIYIYICGIRMCMYTYICMWNMCVYTHVCMCIFTHVCMCICIWNRCVHVYIHAYMCVCGIRVYTHMYVYVCMVCVCVCGEREHTGEIIIFNFPPISCTKYG